MGGEGEKGWGGGGGVTGAGIRVYFCFVFLVRRWPVDMLFLRSIFSEESMTSEII